MDIMTQMQHAKSFVSLPMYDFVELRWATQRLLQALASELTSRGWPTSVCTEEFANHGALVEHWRSPTTALSQSCGLPYLEALVGHAQVIGTFEWSGVSDGRGHYRSVVVVRADDRRELGDLRGAIPVINNPESLSGWCSLGVALADAGYVASDLAPMLMSGAHVRSAQAIASGEADVAAIDAATFALVSRYRHSAVAGLRVIGEGPLIPATPLVTRLNPPIAMSVIRSAIVGALANPAMSEVLAALGIAGFTAFDHDTIVPVEHLEQRASLVLPRQ